MKKIFVILVAVLALNACDKPFEFGRSVALNQKIVELKYGNGSTPVMVYSNTDWDVSLTSHVDWASIDRTHGKGNGEVKFAYSANYGLPRKVGIVITTAEKSDTVMMVQSGIQEKPQFHFLSATIKAPKEGGTAYVPFASDMFYNIGEVVPKVEYESDDTGWIGDISIACDKINFELADNDSGLERRAVITLRHEDATGTVRSSSIEFIQDKSKGYIIFNGSEAPYYSDRATIKLTTNMAVYLPQICSSEFTVEYKGEDRDWIQGIEPNLEKSALDVIVKENETLLIREATVKFSYNGIACNVPVKQGRYVRTMNIKQIKDLIPGASGVYTFEDMAMIEAVVVGDKESRNMERAGNEYKYNYMQESDGSHGLRIECATAGDNIFSRNTLVKLNIEGAKLVKESDPTRYTLSGITVDMLVDQTTGVYPRQKRKYVSALTDDDIYTQTTIKDAEILFRRGSYTNVLEPEGAAYFDAYPLCLHDITGGVIYLITDMNASWRRSGFGVPQGSGTATGILVNQDMPRFFRNGDAGRYCLRTIEQNDLSMTSPLFSKKIVEWDWNENTDLSAILTPTTGNGTIGCNVSYDCCLTKDFNALTSDESNKGMKDGACAFVADTWWDTLNDKAPYFEICFSTKAVTGQVLSFNWTVAQGNGTASTIFAPSVWHLEVSVNGTDFTPLEKEYAVRPLDWGGTSLFAIPGLHEYSAVLPSDLFDREKVWVRFVASGKTAASEDGPEAGSVKAMDGAFIRFGEIQVLYN